MPLGDLSNSRKRLPTPTEEDIWPKRRHLNHGFSDILNSTKVEQPPSLENMNLPGSQQSTANMTSDHKWDLNGAVELNIEAGWKFNYGGSYAGLLSTYSSLALMKSCLSSKSFN